VNVERPERAVEKRSKFQIYFDLLQLLCRESKSNNKPSYTRIAHEANLPYDRFRNYLNHLVQLGMVSDGEGGKLIVTNRGLEYIQEYRKINDFLRRMGLLP
jgi:predicted transcriptional regulator